MKYKGVELSILGIRVRTDNFNWTPCETDEEIKMSSVSGRGIETLAIGRFPRWGNPQSEVENPTGLYVRTYVRNDRE